MTIIKIIIFKNNKINFKILLTLLKKEFFKNEEILFN